MGWPTQWVDQPISFFAQWRFPEMASTSLVQIRKEATMHYIGWIISML